MVISKKKKEYISGNWEIYNIIYKGQHFIEKTTKTIGW